MDAFIGTDTKKYMETHPNRSSRNFAIELGLADRGWFMYSPGLEEAVCELNKTKVSDMEITEVRIGPSIGRFDPQASCESFIAISYFAEGMDTLETPMGRLHIASGDCVIWHSGSPCVFNVQEPIRMLNISFKEKHLRNQIINIPEVAGMHFKPGDPFGKMLGGFLEGLLAEWRGFSDADLVLALLAARNLMVKAILKRKSEQLQDPDAGKLQRAMRLIDQRLYDPELKPQDLADAMHMSLRSLYLIFSKSNLTVVGYIRDRRLDDCRHVLAGQRSDLNMNQLALSRGFNDLSTFSRAFKRKFGMSPIEYRKWLSQTLNSPNP